MKKIVLFLLAVLSAAAMSAQTVKISGTVSDSDGNPLPGVAVLVEGTGIGTTTNADGQYSMVVRSDQSHLVYSCIGMQTMKVPVMGRTVIDVKMSEDAIGLSQSVITATGLTRSEVCRFLLPAVQVHPRKSSSEVILPSTEATSHCTL